MREILFRGKAINRDNGFHRTNYKNGDFVYGLATRLYDERFENLPAEMTGTNGVSGIEVDYKTIGQYTGLTDKNGKKIFEGDVVLYPWNGQDNPERFTIKFKDGQFVASPVKETEDYWDFMVGGYSEEMEIIGNIHDNPELLENP